MSKRQLLRINLYIRSMKKQKCTQCNHTKKVDEFDTKNGKPTSYCSECRREKLRAHYLNNKEYYYTKNKNRTLNNRKRLKEYKETLRCTDCDMPFKGCSCICDFHHLDPSKKDIEISRLCNYSWDIILKEIQKCAPLCANCHRLRHHVEE